MLVVYYKTMDLDPEPVETTILNLNRNAMAMIRDLEFSKALVSLKQASSLLKIVEKPNRRLKLQGITLNNFGCFYKKVKKPNVALKCLTKACEREEIAEVDGVNLAATHLNMCAIYSELGKHEIALGESLKALNMLKKVTTSTSNLLTTLVIAYHNAGVEYEYLNRYAEALECYKIAWETSNTYLGPLHPLTMSIKSNTINAQQKIYEKDVRNNLKEFNKKHSVLGKSRFRSAAKKIDKNDFNDNPMKTFYDTRASNTPKDRKFVNKEETATKDIKTLKPERLKPMLHAEVRVKSLPKEFSPHKTQLQAEARIKSLPKDFAHNKTQTPKSYNKNPPKNFLKISPKKNSKKISDLDTLARNKKPDFEYENIEKMLLDHYKENAAVKIQKNFRGYLTRKSIKASSIKRNFNTKKKTILVLQELEDLKNQVELHHMILSKTPGSKSLLEVIPEIPDNSSPDPTFKILKRVQGLIKGYLCRSFYMTLNLSAIKIQKAIRRHQCSKIYKSIKEAVICIQSYYRGHKVRKQVIISSN